MSKRIELALALARFAHEGQTDKSGADYIQHPLAVAAQFEDEDLQIVALLHDVLEDTFVGADTIDNLFGKAIKDAVVALSRNPDELYEDFIRRAAANPLAKEVKKADLRHNMDLTRLNQVTEKDIARVEKYKKALAYLEQYNMKKE